MPSRRPHPVLVVRRPASPFPAGWDPIPPALAGGSAFGGTRSTTAVSGGGGRYRQAWRGASPPAGFGGSTGGSARYGGASWSRRQFLGSVGLAGVVSGVGVGLGDLPDSAVSTIASTIQQVEGYYPGSLAYINNNPGNLRYVGQPGAWQGQGGYAAFPSYQAGLDALNRQIQLYAGRGMTISQMMAIYAPASDGNDPTSYAARVASALGVSPSTALSDLGAAAPWIPAGVLDVVGLPADNSALVGLGLGLAALLLLVIL
jgi:hypothetical protein